MSVVIEPGGAQVLPRSDDPQQRLSTWAAYCCIDADHRLKHPVYARLADDLRVYASTSASSSDA